MKARAGQPVARRTTIHDIEDAVMLRVLLLGSLAGMLAQVIPQGCSDTTPVQQPTDRGSITTSAHAPATAEVGATVVLSAGASADPAGGPISYNWAQMAGPGVMLSSANQSEASFVAPSLAAEDTLSFTVTTTNTAGDIGSASVDVKVAADPDYGVVAQGSSSGPIARAGADQTVPGTGSVTLDGSNSRGNSLTYKWSQVSGTTVTLTNADTSKATFTAPAYQAKGDNGLEFQLEIHDSQNRRATDNVVITVRVPTPSDDTNPTPQVRITTTMGEFVVELNRTKAPLTVGNFLEYVDTGFYPNTLIHRVIKDFVIQGGGYKTGMVLKSTPPAVQSEASNGLKNVRGSIAMARTSDVNSATSQFYINLVDNTSLDHSDTQEGYTVFGTVIEGMSVVDAIAQVATHTFNGFNDVPVTDILITAVERITPIQP